MDNQQLLDKNILESPIKKTKLSNNTGPGDAQNITYVDPRVASIFTDITNKEFENAFNQLKESVSWKEDILSVLNVPSVSKEFTPIYSTIFCEFWKDLATFIYKNEIVTSPLDLIISDIMKDYQTSSNRTVRLAAYNFLFSFLLCSPSSDLFEKLYSKAFRDVFYSIRILSIVTLNEFTKDCDLKDFVLQDQKIKYAGWLLNDKDYKVRELALVFIGRMLLCEDTSTFGKADKNKFYKKFGPRIEDMLHDKNPNVVIKVIDLLEKTKKGADYDTLILEDNVKIRTKMVDVYTEGKKVNIPELEKLLKDTLKANYQEEDKTKLFVRAISMFITKKRLIIDYSLIKKFNDFEYYLTMSLLSLINKNADCKDNTTQIMSAFYRLFKKLCTTKNYKRLKTTLNKLAEDKVNIILKQQESTFVYNKITGLLKESNEREYISFLISQLINNNYNRESLLTILKTTIILPNMETNSTESRDKKNIGLVKELLLVINEHIPNMRFFIQKEPHVDWIKSFVLNNTLLDNFIFDDASYNIMEIILLQLAWRLNIAIVLNNNFSSDILLQTNIEETINNISDEDEQKKLRFLIEVLNRIDLQSIGHLLISLIEFSKNKKQKQLLFNSKILQYLHMLMIMLGGIEAKKQNGSSSLLHILHEEQLLKIYKDISSSVANFVEKMPIEDTENFKFIIKSAIFLDFISEINDFNLGNIKLAIIIKMLNENVRKVNEGLTKTHIQIFRDIKRVRDETYTSEMYLILCYQLVKNGHIEDLELIRIQDFRKLFFGNKGRGIENGIMKAIDYIKTDISIDMEIKTDIQERVLYLVDMFLSTFNIHQPNLNTEIKKLFEQNN